MDLFRFLRGVFGGGAPEEIQKQDIAEVEAVIVAVLPIVERWWRNKINSAVTYLLGELERYTEALGTEDVDVLAGASSPRARSRILDEEVTALLATLEERLGCPLEPAAATAVESAARDLMEAGALALGFLTTVQSPRDAMTARRALTVLLWGRIEGRRGELRKALEGYLTSRQIREGARVTVGLTLPLSPQSLAFAKWKETLRTTLGSAWTTWGPQTVDAWAYSWHNVGRFHAGEQAGVRRWVALNPKDERTTPFCNWVHGKLISARRARSKLKSYYRAVDRGDLASMRSIWPLDNPGNVTSAFRRIFNTRGLPPYHFRCRTVAVPA